MILILFLVLKETTKRQNKKKDKARLVPLESNEQVDVFNILN